MLVEARVRERRKEMGLVLGAGFRNLKLIFLSIEIKNFLKCLDFLISSIVLLISAIIARKYETSPQIKDS